MRLKKLILFSLLFCVVLLSAINKAFVIDEPVKKKFHSEKEAKTLQNELSVPIAPGEYFLTHEHCRNCHGYDSLNYANITSTGESINLLDDWEATMMANSARDPLWRAKVSHEILVNPAHSLELQDKCTSCHAPMGHYTSFFKGYQHYTIADLDNDTLGIDGVSCSGCHTIGPNGLGNMFSGNIPYDTNKVEYGPFLNPIVGPMQLYVGFLPTHSSHVSESKFCSPCHTLQTQSVDLLGVPTGRTFTEQATYHEWLNSAASQDNITCQACHMPQSSDSIRIANQYLNIQKRFPFNQHKFQGGNTFMIGLIKQNKSKLGIKTPDKNFDSTLAITTDNLRYNTLDVDLLLDSVSNDSAFVRVRLLNKAGHKFPSGYPARRAVLQMAVVGSVNDTIFESGMFDSNYEVKNIDNPFEKHYNIINSEQQAQIYEMVMGDVNKNKTTVLERADTLLKDNRLVPEGFLTTAPMYDTIKIVGDAESDPDFNKFSNGSEGNGRDVVHYHIPLNGYTSSFKIVTKVYYQPVPPAYLAEMFSYSSAPIDSFKAMYNAANKAPSLVGCDSVTNITVNIKSYYKNNFVISPDPTSDGNISIYVPKNFALKNVSVYTSTGQLVQKIENNLMSPIQLTLPDTRGIYYVEIFDGKQVLYEKVIRE